MLLAPELRAAQEGRSPLAADRTPFPDDDRRVDLAPGPRAMGPWVAR
jgi:hypothetical protein